MRESGSRKNETSKNEERTHFKAVAQEHGMGCAVACVAHRCRISYDRALSLFKEPANAWTRGFYCRDVVEALARAGIHASVAEFEPARHGHKLEERGAIVFIAACVAYPAGHYLIRTSRGWMNPWANYPKMVPVKAAIQRELPGRVSHIVF